MTYFDIFFPAADFFFPELCLTNEQKYGDEREEQSEGERE